MTEKNTEQELKSQNQKQETTQIQNKPKHKKLVSIIYTLAGIALFIGAEIILSLVLLIIYSILGKDIDTLIDLLGDSATAAFLYISAVGIIRLVLAYLLIKKMGGLKSVGFGRIPWKKMPWALVGWGIYILGTVATFAFLATAFPDLNLDQEQDIGFSTDLAGLELALVFVAIVVISPS